MPDVVIYSTSAQHMVVLFRILRNHHLSLFTNRRYINQNDCQLK